MKEEYKLEDFKSELHSLCDFGCFYHCSIGGQQKPNCIETFKTNKMKEELEKLGFEYSKDYSRYRIELPHNTILFVNNEKQVKMFRNKEMMTLFPYNHEKLKQLIQLLS